MVFGIKVLVCESGDIVGILGILLLFVKNSV